MSHKKLLIRGATVVDPSQNINGKKDILVENGVIARLAGKISDTDADIFDAKGMFVFPGLIDMHTHLREPGAEEAETVQSGCEAAAAGGYTAVCPMPNTTPAMDDPGRVRYVVGLAKGAKARVYPIGALTVGRKGEDITEMAAMVEEGAIAFSDDGCSVKNAEIMRHALRYAAMIGKPVLGHEEDPYLARDGQMNEGALSAELGLRGIPPIAEETMTSRDIAIAEYTKTPFHVTHISTRGVLDIIKAAKTRGVRVTCDVTPHHLTLTEDLLTTYDTRYKMNPPLRSVDDVEAMREGIRDGSIDAIATDHAPHSLELKMREFIYAPFGVTGLETALAVVQKSLIDTGVIDWTRAIELLSCTPAKLLGVEGGTLAKGSVADVAIYDPKDSWKVEPEKMKSRSTNTCYFDWKLPGRVQATVLGGELYRNV